MIVEKKCEFVCKVLRTMVVHGVHPINASNYYCQSPLGILMKLSPLPTVVHFPHNPGQRELEQRINMKSLIL